MGNHTSNRIPTLDTLRDSDKILTTKINQENDKTLNSNLLSDVDVIMLLDEINHPIFFKPAALSKKSRFLELLKMIPWLSGLLSRIDAVSSKLINLSQLEGNVSSSLDKASSTLQWVDLALAIINFVRIPAIFLAAAILKEPLPFTLSKAGQWAYSGALLGLTIASFIVPGVGPIIGLTTAAFVLGVSIFTLGRLFYQRWQIKEQLKNLNTAIAAETNNLEKIRSKANELQHTAVSTLDALKLKEDYHNCCERLQHLSNQKGLYEHKLAKRDSFAIANKAVGTSLVSLTLAGLVTAVFFPPVGLIIMASASAAGLLYLIGRVLIPPILSKPDLADKETAEDTYQADPDDIETQTEFNHSTRVILTIPDSPDSIEDSHVKDEVQAVEEAKNNQFKDNISITAPSTVSAADPDTTVHF